MYINLFTHQVLPFFKEKILSSLTPQQKRVCALASIALCCLAASYALFHRYYLRAKKSNQEMESEISANLFKSAVDLVENQEILRVELEGAIRLQLTECQLKCLSVPGECRLELFKLLYQEDSQNPELVASLLVKEMLACDLNYAMESRKNWECSDDSKRDIWMRAQRNMAEFIQTIEEKEAFSLLEHSIICFKLSAIMSGVELKDLDKLYDEQLKTMVKGVVHPKGVWTVRNVLNEQNYAKFICHVSNDGLVSIPLLNSSVFRVNKDSEPVVLRFLAVPCASNVGFDGVNDTGSFAVFRHDLIHAGFLKRHFQTNPKDYEKYVKKICVIYEEIQKIDDPLLRKEVELAFFMFTHEYTTSVFVRGWPKHLTKKRLLKLNKYIEKPQILLLIATFFKLKIPPFENEVDNMAGMAKSLDLSLNITDNKYALLKEILHHLDRGYQYLDKNFGEFYNKN